MAEDECRHFLLLEARLKELGSHYGALSAHDGLWESASHTSHRYRWLYGGVLFGGQIKHRRLCTGPMRLKTTCLCVALIFSLPARLAVESCTHEARGLDVLPATIAKFRNNGDEPSAQLLEDIVYPEEIGHCRAGVRWFR